MKNKFAERVKFKTVTKQQGSQTLDVKRVAREVFKTVTKQQGSQTAL